MGMHRNLKSIIAAVAAGALALATAGCGQGTNATEPADPSDTSPISVVASVNQWGSLARQIGGDDVAVTSILSSTGVDAHDFEPKTSDAAKIAKAEVVVSNGAGYDSWATKSLSRTTINVSAASVTGAMDGDNPHLWFSKDARAGMAKELTDTFCRVRPALRKDFEKRYEQWKTQEEQVEKLMSDFADAHEDPSYAATEAVAYYLMADMGFKDKTPKGYAQSAASEGEAAPADLQEFQSLIESHEVDVVVNNTQEASDATNMITGSAGKSDVPVFDVTEQMPGDYTTLTDWIAALVGDLSDLLDTAETGDADAGEAAGETGESAGESADAASDGASEETSGTASDTSSDAQ